MFSLGKANFTFTFNVIEMISYIQARRTDLYVISKKEVTLNLDIKHSRWSTNYKHAFYSIINHTQQGICKSFCGP